MGLRRKYLNKIVNTWTNAGKIVAPGGTYRYVDKSNGADGNTGLDWANAFATTQAAITASSQGDTVVIAPVEVAAGDTDPGSYSENLIIAPAQAFLTLIGVPRGRAQGGLPQLKVGATTTAALLTIRAPGCTIRNLGFNGSGGTGGGILLDEATATGQAWGTAIENCHFKNCVGTTATNAATGGAIQWSASGGAWQVLIKGNRFYKNVGDVVLKGTSSSVPQDVVIEDNIFSGPAANVDCNLYLAGGSGMNGVVIRNNCFTAVPAIGSGTNAQFLALTGCVGILADNTFAASVAEGGSERTFGAAGNELVPTTVFMARNYGEFATGVGAGLVSGEIFRT
jgi:hypothetical protein